MPIVDASTGKRPLNLMWRRTTLDRVPEAHFIERTLLGRLGRPVRVLTTETMAAAPFVDDLLVVSLTYEFSLYLAEARMRGRRNLMVLHLGDEHGDSGRGFYAHADLVLRNYWFPHIFTDPKILWVPNGYATGVGPAGSLLPTRARTSAAFFAGAIAMRTLSGERHAMQQAVERDGLPFTLHVTPNSRARLGPLSYAAGLGNARFALVPGGNSPETIRLYDALEMGSIPIMLRSGFVETDDALGRPPFLLLDDWGELADAWRPFSRENPETLAALDALQAQVVDWWTAFKRSQQEKVRHAIDAVLQD